MRSPYPQAAAGPASRCLRLVAARGRSSHAGFAPDSAAE